MAILKLLGFLLLATAFQCDAREFVHEETSFESHGQKILVDVFAPKDQRPVASVLIFHGAGGLLFDGPEMKRVAQELTTHSMCAYIVHYFDGSGVPFTTHDSTLRRHHDEWLAVVRDAVDWVRNPPGMVVMSPRPVGVYGYSMGAYLGVEASADNLGVGALVEQSGGVWDNETARLGRRMPPVLMIHGRLDRRVPFGQYAMPLERALRQRGAKVETYFFDQEGHRFSRVAAASARLRAAQFFAAKLASKNSAAEQGKPVRRLRRATIQRR